MILKLRGIPKRQLLVNLRGIPDKDAQKYGAAEELSVYSLSGNGKVLGEKVNRAHANPVFP